MAGSDERHHAGGARTGRLARALGRATAPLGYAVLAGLIGLSLGPAQAPAPAAVPEDVVVEVRTPLSPAELALVEQTRLTALGTALVRDEQDEALDLARAAVMAGEVAVALAQDEGASVDPTVLDELRDAHETLAAVAAPRPLDVEPDPLLADVEPVPVALDVDPVPLPTDAELVSVTVGTGSVPRPPDATIEPEPAASDAGAPGDPAQEPGTAPEPDADTLGADELEEAAQRVFALSFQVEQVVREVTDGDLAREHRVTTLEQTAAAARATVPLPALEARRSFPGTGVTWPEDPWPNGGIPHAALCAPEVAPAALLRCDAAAALDALNEAYRLEHGQDLAVTSAYRSHEEQAELRRTLGWLAAPAGRSNHGRGVAVDLAGLGGLGEFDAPAYRWMRQHAPAFGWHHPDAMRPGGSGPPEPWHWEFAGVPTAG